MKWLLSTDLPSVPATGHWDKSAYTCLSTGCTSDSSPQNLLATLVSCLLPWEMGLCCLLILIIIFISLQFLKIRLQYLRGPACATEQWFNTTLWQKTGRRNRNKRTRDQNNCIGSLCGACLSTSITVNSESDVTSTEESDHSCQSFIWLEGISLLPLSKRTNKNIMGN